MCADDIIITDIVHNRLAKELGATHTLTVSKDLHEADLVKRVHNILGTAPDVSIDCSGIEVTNRLALLTTKSGGCVVIVGCSPPDVKVPLISGLTCEIDICGVFRNCIDYPATLALVSNGKINVKRLITHHFDTITMVQLKL